MRLWYDAVFLEGRMNADQAQALRDTLTKGERSLVADGRAQLVLDMRKAYQQTMRNDLVAGVEEITGRKVIAFFSDNHIDPDMAMESFVLEPAAHLDGATPVS